MNNNRVLEIQKRVHNDDEFEYKIACPVCDKRVFDLTDFPTDNVSLRMKCPHCRKIIHVPIFVSAS